MGSGPSRLIGGEASGSYRSSTLDIRRGSVRARQVPFDICVKVGGMTCGAELRCAVGVGLSFASSFLRSSMATHASSASERDLRPPSLGNLLQPVLARKHANCSTWSEGLHDRSRPRQDLAPKHDATRPPHSEGHRDVAGRMTVREWRE